MVIVALILCMAIHGYRLLYMIRWLYVHGHTCSRLYMVDRVFSQCLKLLVGNFKLCNYEFQNQEVSKS